ncbi:MAG: MMPL family transporter [Rhodothermales bacterium]
MSPWSRAAVWILDHPRPIWTAIAVVTVFTGLLMGRLEIDHTAGNFVSEEDEFVRVFEETTEVFGRSETILYVVFHDVHPIDSTFLHRLDTLTSHVQRLQGVESVLSLANVPHLRRDNGSLHTETLYQPDLSDAALRLRFDQEPFLNGILLSEDRSATLMMVRIDPVFNASRERIDLVHRVHDAAEAMPGRAALAGFPYLRSQYAERVTREAPLFTVLALLISLLFLFITFRARRAVVVPTIIVLLGIVWTFGLMGLFGHKLNLVTAVLPALIVIIGMANAIHLSTKFFDQFSVTQDRREAIVEMVRTVGLATFLTALTTAVGFAVLLLSGNRILMGFGAFAAMGIMLLYVLSITIIPLTYSRMRPPRANVSSLATHDRFGDYFDAKARLMKRRGGTVIVVAAALAVLAVVGATRISTDIFVFADFYEDDPLRQDLAVFEEHFGGVLPMEVVVESDREGRFKTLAPMRRIEALQDTFSTFDAVGTSLSAVDLVKMGNQAYFGGHPGAYRLPASYELPFLQEALGRFIGQEADTTLLSNLPIFVDSTFSMTRIYLGVSDIGTERMNELADSVATIAESAFSGDEYTVYVTGTAVMSTRSGESLVHNLIVSLTVALMIISVLMAFLFRSIPLTFISLAPNIIPLLLVGGAMGYAGITLKPSTALIFSLAFGIAVDDTIHFLAKFRIHRDEGDARDEAIRKTLRETGKAILFTSLILMSGFLVFTLSSFGGTVTMGALTALTLGVALVANLFLLPALLFRYGPDEHRRTASPVDRPSET